MSVKARQEQRRPSEKVRYDLKSFGEGWVSSKPKEKLSYAEGNTIFVQTRGLGEPSDGTGVVT